MYKKQNCLNICCVNSNSVQQSLIFYYFVNSTFSNLFINIPTPLFQRRFDWLEIFFNLKNIALLQRPNVASLPWMSGAANLLRLFDASIGARIANVT